MSGSTKRLTMAQALVEFLANQYSERDGTERRLIAGCFGIFGHGNVAGVGQALQESGERMRYYQARNEQGMVHAASGYARMKNRLSTLACTTSIGPGATNMVTGAALATINRLPVLLLPGDVFASRGPGPVLQQVEHPLSADVSVNDCFEPVSRYWDRISRPEQLISSALEAMRVLTDAAETGAVTLALCQDVQAEAYDYPAALFERRVWRIRRPPPEPEVLARAVDVIRTARRPLIVAGGGVVYSEATDALRRLVDDTGVPVAQTQAGKGSLPYNHPSCLGAVGVTGTRGANLVAKDADVVIGIGTRWTDFTTASRTAFEDPLVRFVNLNIAPVDAGKHAGVPLVADARAGIDSLTHALVGFRAGDDYVREVEQHVRAWDEEVERIYHLGHGPLMSQGEVIGAVNDAAGPRDVVVCAAGSIPGDLHKLWRAQDPKSYHVEYGYSCMGYEIPGGIGVKMAAPDREVFVMIGDGSYLMMPQDVVTAIAEGIKLVIVLVDNHGFASIGGLSESIGSGGFGTRYRFRGPSGELDGDRLPVDLAANAASLGAEVIRAETADALRDALKVARDSERTIVIHVETDPSVTVPSYESWWDVPIAEVARSAEVTRARGAYDEKRKSERPFL
ncbi:3D-(3,5/4)-trihydroxycyclohexane-1,2-dione acylhydrolase (decyclizing) [soil metagenome]